MKEYELQKAVCKYLELQQVLFCGSMGGQYQMHMSQRIKAKKSGYKKGFPDLFIYEIAKINDVIYHGLAIELKTKTGRPSKEQKEWIRQLQKRGYKASICKGIDETINEINNYLKYKL
tara:strand:- start:1150 stop:1503 length:354 start_codon:yes stop_codon:yes gene_type:complete